MPPSPRSSLGPVLLGLVLVAGARSPAHADRFAIGASVGAGQGEGGSSSTFGDATDRTTSRGVFGRLRLFAGLSIEAEVGRAELERDGGRNEDGGGPLVPSSGKSGTLTARYDLLGSGSLRPHLLAGVGIENWRSEYIEWSYSRREVGGGIDVVVGGGLRIGIDVRVGKRELVDTRFVDDQEVILIFPGDPLGGDHADYVAGRLTLGAGF